MRHRQPHAPGPRLALAELDQAADLERLERREPQPHARDRRARRPRHAVVADLHHPRAVLARAARTSTRVGRACLLRVAHRLDEHGLGERLERRAARRPLRCPARARSRARVGLAQPLDLLLQRRRPSRATMRPSGRCSARRRSRSPACSSTGHALARLARQRRVARDDEQHAEQPLDHALVHLAREVDPLLQLARAAPAGTSRGAPPRRAPTVLPSVHSRLRSSSESGRRGRRSARITPLQRPPAESGTQTSVGVVEQVAEALGHLARDRLGVHLDHAVLDERLARDRRRLDGDVRAARSGVEVDAEGARRAHAAARLVVAEDHRAVHRREPADRLAERGVEARRRSRRPRRA